MDAQVIIALITALGLGSVVPQIVSGAMAQFSGRAEAERKRNADALAMRDAAWARADAIEDKAQTRVGTAEAERDAAEARARIMSEYASSLRAILLETGYRYSDLPAWPESRPGSLVVGTDERQDKTEGAPPPKS